uniref:Uncharacterized protein n=1 Tax=Pan paniscus TaxID=9597 RepID=A0A2R8ZBQ5_PANPA
MFFSSSYSEVLNPSRTRKVKFEFCFVLICKVKMKTENKGFICIYLSNHSSIHPSLQLVCVYVFLYKITMY